jgi:hypothetical protein
VKLATHQPRRGVGASKGSYPLCGLLLFYLAKLAKVAFASASIASRGNRSKRKKFNIEIKIKNNIKFILFLLKGNFLNFI